MYFTQYFSRKFTFQINSENTSTSLLDRWADICYNRNNSTMKPRDKSMIQSTESINKIEKVMCPVLT